MKRVLFAVIAAIVVLLAGTLTYIELTRTPHSPGPSGGTVPRPVTYYEARANASAAIKTTVYRGWQLMGVGASQSSSAVVANVTALMTPGCDVKNQPKNTPYDVDVPAVPGVVGTGDALLWVFFYSNYSYGTLVTVLNGVARVVGELSSFYPPCIPERPYTINASVIDSPLAMSTAMGAGGARFLAAYPEANISLVLGAGYRFYNWSSPPIWFVQFAACPPFGVVEGGNVSGPTLNVTVNADNGTVITKQNGTAPCSGVSPWVYSLTQVFEPAGSIASTNNYGNYSYEFGTVEAGYVEPTDLLITLTANGVPVVLPGGAFLELLRLPNQSLVAEYNLSSDQWFFGANRTIYGGDLFVMFVGQSNLAGDQINIIGVQDHYGLWWACAP